VIDDPMDAQLAVLDPARREAPPAPGSVRHASILERALSGTDTTLVPVPQPESARPRRRWRPYAVAMAAAVVVVAVACAALLPRDSGDADAVGLLSSAADTTAVVTSLRVAIAEEDRYHAGTRTLEVVGDRVREQTYGTYRDGHVEGATTVFMGVDVYEERIDGGRETFRLDRTVSPFASSSQAVLDAATSSHDVAVVGQDTVRDVATTHYRITLDAASRSALAGLDPEVLGWFGLADGADQVRTVDVWVGGDLIRRMRVKGDESVWTADYYDFNAHIDVQPPDWAGTVTPGEG